MAFSSLVSLVLVLVLENSANLLPILAPLPCHDHTTLLLRCCTKEQTKVCTVHTVLYGISHTCPWRAGLRGRHFTRQQYQGPGMVPVFCLLPLSFFASPTILHRSLFLHFVAPSLIIITTPKTAAATVAVTQWPPLRVW
jgi:hypothetical protein